MAWAPQPSQVIHRISELPIPSGRAWALIPILRHRKTGHLPKVTQPGSYRTKIKILSPHTYSPPDRAVPACSLKTHAINIHCKSIANKPRRWALPRQELAEPRVPVLVDLHGHPQSAGAETLRGGEAAVASGSQSKSPKQMCEHKQMRSAMRSLLTALGSTPGRGTTGRGGDSH